MGKAYWHGIISKFYAISLDVMWLTYA